MNELIEQCLENNEFLDETSTLLYSCKYKYTDIAMKCLCKIQTYLKKKQTFMTNKDDFGLIGGMSYVDIDFDKHPLLELLYKTNNTDNALTYACRNDMKEIAIQWHKCSQIFLTKIYKEIVKNSYIYANETYLLYGKKYEEQVKYSRKNSLDNIQDITREDIYEKYTGIVIKMMERNKRVFDV